MPTIQQLVSENRDNSIIAQELLKKTPVEAITICISIILALIKSLEKKMIRLRCLNLLLIY